MKERDLDHLHGGSWVSTQGGVIHKVTGGYHTSSVDWQAVVVVAVAVAVFVLVMFVK